MTPDVVTVDEDATLAQIVSLLERHRIKRVPVVRDGRVIGIVSRANLLQGLASQPPAGAPVSLDDRALKDRVEQELKRAGVDAIFVNVVVASGVAHLWGAVRSEEQRDAARIATESVAGASAVRSHLSVFSTMVQAVLWAE